METLTLSSLPSEIRPLILCATSRLAQSLNKQYADLMTGAGKSRWETLNAQTVSAWLDSLEEELALRSIDLPEEFSRRVISDFEARLLFESIISKSLGGTKDLFDIGSMAANALEAYRVSSLWPIVWRGEPLSEEQQHFVRWREEFLKICDKEGLVDETRISRLLTHLLAEADLRLPELVLFAGFDRYTPTELGIQDALRKRGISVGELEVSLNPGQAKAVSYPDTTAECMAAATWAKAILEIKPKATIGIVIPDLAGCRNLIQDTLDTVLAPSAYRAKYAEMPSLYNISLGQPLGNYPIIRSGLDLLDLIVGSQHVAFDQWSALLLSPFWSSIHLEGDVRAIMDAKMREGRTGKVSLKSLIKSIGYWSTELARSTENLTQHLTQLDREGSFSGKPRKPSEWARFFQQGLDKCGWLAEYSLSSYEFQTRQAFNEELRKLAGLDSVLKEISSYTALFRLKQLCRERVFQPKTLGSRSIQVLGALEAAGLQFDALWIMGMNDHAWPPPAKLNPFLPAGQQRTLETPNASVGVQLNFAKSVHRRLLHAASEVVFSWPKRSGDSELHPSPILGDLLPGAEGPLVENHDWVLKAAMAKGAAYDEPRLDDTAPPVAEGEHVRGGTGLLRAQAICPAWAFYQYRLGARKLKASTEGLDNSARGKVVHDALEFFWKKVITSKALHELSAEAIQRILSEGATFALDRYDTQPGQEALTPKQRQLEQERLIKLTTRWIDLEKKRGINFTAIDNEREAKVVIQGIEVTMRIDRIDQLEDGSLIIIDYKTGTIPEIKNWGSDRITEPQLPIYAAIAKPAEGPVAGVAFGKVRLKTKEVGFAGLVSVKDLLMKVESFDSSKNRKIYPEPSFPNWESVMLHWEARIKAIADEVRQGVAAVTFEKEKSLEYCDVRPLLRLPERKAQLEKLSATGGAE